MVVSSSNFKKLKLGTIHQVSTYCLSVEDVLEVESDKVIVYDEAFSRVQRLTKVQISYVGTKNNKVLFMCWNIHDDREIFYF